jgi:hypothetical protein
MSGPSLLLLAAVLALPTGSDAQRAAACDRTCLEATLDGYVDALVAPAPARLPLAAPGVTFTENGHRLELGDGLWNTVTGRGRYALKLADAEAGQAVLMGTIREAGTPTILVVRLKIASRRISEVETLVVRNQMATESLDAIGTRRRVWSQPVPEPERLTRAELVRIANMYFSGIELNDGKGEKGLIDAVESVLHPVPYGMGSGWSSYADAMSSTPRW